MTDLTKSTSAELLKLYAGVGTELRRRGIVRSENITGDVAEYLFCLALQPNTNTPLDRGDAYDASLFAR